MGVHGCQSDVPNRGEAVGERGSWSGEVQRIEAAEAGEAGEAGGLAMARMLLDRAEAIHRSEPSAGELRYLNTRLVEMLREVVTVADARGARLGLPCSDAAFLAHFGFPPKDGRAADGDVLMRPRGLGRNPAGVHLTEPEDAAGG